MTQFHQIHLISLSDLSRYILIQVISSSKHLFSVKSSTEPAASPTLRHILVWLRFSGSQTETHSEFAWFNFKIQFIKYIQNRYLHVNVRPSGTVERMQQEQDNRSTASEYNQTNMFHPVLNGEQLSERHSLIFSSAVYSFIYLNSWLSQQSLEFLLNTCLSCSVQHHLAPGNWGWATLSQKDHHCWNILHFLSNPES